MPVAHVAMISPHARSGKFVRTALAGPDRARASYDYQRAARDAIYFAALFGRLK
jgi:hypothetical protein